MELLKATLKDADELAELNLALMIAEEYDQKQPLEKLIPRMRNFLETSYDVFFISTEGHKAGYILINKSVSPLYIRQFYIKPEYQRQGLGHKTIEAIQDYYNTKTFDVEVMSWNDIGLNFWKKYTQRIAHIPNRRDPLTLFQYPVINKRVTILAATSLYKVVLSFIPFFVKLY